MSERDPIKQAKLAQEIAKARSAKLRLERQELELERLREKVRGPTPEERPEPITAPELCKVLEVSRSTLAKYIQMGLPRDQTKRPYRYDADACRAWIKRNIRPRGGDMHDLEPLSDSDDEEPLTESEARDLYRQERAKKTKAERELREMKLEEERGELVRAADVRAEWHRAVLLIRSVFLELPARLAAPLAEAGTEAEAELIVDRAIRDTLEELAASDE